MDQIGLSRERSRKLPNASLARGTVTATRHRDLQTDLVREHLHSPRITPVVNSHDGRLTSVFLGVCHSTGITFPHGAGTMTNSSKNFLPLQAHELLTDLEEEAINTTGLPMSICRLPESHTACEAHAFRKVTTLGASVKKVAPSFAIGQGALALDDPNGAVWVDDVNHVPPPFVVDCLDLKSVASYRPLPPRLVI